MNPTEAAQLLGMPEHEIVSVMDSPAGDLITTHDGITLVNVPADKPDGEGKTGLMFLAAPSETYGGSFPVFVLPADHDGALAAQIGLAGDADAPTITGDGSGTALPEAAAVALMLAERHDVDDDAVELHSFTVEGDGAGGSVTYGIGGDVLVAHWLIDDGSLELDGPSEPADPTQDPVPVGNATAVLEWVGEDVERARRARDGELAGKNRKGLIKDLDALIPAE